MLGFSNATLTAVGTAEFIAEGAREEDSTPRWAGSVEAYFQEKRERAREGDDSSVRIRRSLIVGAEDEGPIAFEEDDTVQFTFDGEERVGVVAAVERRKLNGHPLQTTRVTLREE